MLYDKFSLLLGYIKLFFCKLFYPTRIHGICKARFSHKFIIRSHRKCKLYIGKRCRARGYLNIYLDNKAIIKLGNNVFLNNGCSINALENIEIGDNTIIGEDVKFYDHNHKFNGQGLIKDQGFSTAPIHIGENTWIGSNVTVLKGVTVGNNCVIGANILLNFNVPDNTIVKNVKNQIIIEEIKR